MNFRKFPLLILSSLVFTLLVGIASFGAQTQSTALERGYRTGYSDGYNSGFRDKGDKAARDYQSKDEYQKADRSYNSVWGPIEDYRDGYQQGFEVGYASGYDNQQFDSTIPTGLRRRSDVQSPTSSVGSTAQAQPADATDAGTATVTNNGSIPAATASISIPRNTVLTLELVTPLSTDLTQRGDHFEARVIEPNEFSGATVEGRVSEVKRPGKVKGVAELQLSFEQIRTSDNRTAPFHASLIEIVSSGREEATVDPEGGVRGRDSTKDDVAKVGAASGIGAIIGGIAGGGKGAAIGAVIGGGAGTAGTMTQRGKEIRLDRGQQMKVRTSTDTSVL